MRYYNTDNSEKLFLSPYVKYRLVPTGCLFEHSITRTVALITAGRKQISSILKLLQLGASKADLESAFDGINGYRGEIILVSFVRKGMIE